MMLKCDWVFHEHPRRENGLTITDAKDEYFNFLQRFPNLLDFGRRIYQTKNNNSQNQNNWTNVNGGSFKYTSFQQRNI